MPSEFHAIQPAKTKPKKTVTFADPLTNDLSSLSLQSDDQPTADMQMQPWAMVATEEIDTTLPEDHDFGATNRTAWNLIKDQLILAEKCRGRATLAHNARLVERLPDWSLGMRKIPSLMIPNSKRDAYFTLLKKQAVEKLHFMEEVLTSEADLCDRVAAIHTETMTRCLETEDDKRLFPLMRNRVTKLARSRWASYGKRIYDNLATNPITKIEMEDSLIEPLPHQEFQQVQRPRNRSRSPVRSYHPRSRSPKPRPSGPRASTSAPRGGQNNNRGGRQQHAPQSQNRNPNNRPRSGYGNSRRPQQLAADRASQPPQQLSASELAGLQALLDRNGGN